MTKIAIIYYSTYGHVAAMADAIKESIDETGAQCDIYQVEETLSDEVLAAMYAPPKRDDPIITADMMSEYDGFLFGISGRFGGVPAQLKSFMDSCVEQWKTGALHGKTAGTFVGTAQQGGGQETSHLAMLSFIVHQGMVYVPIGYANPGLMNLDEIHGGCPYGAGTLANSDGSRMPSEVELSIARTQGQIFSATTGKLSQNTPSAPTKKVTKVIQKEAEKRSSVETSTVGKGEEVYV